MVANKSDISYRFLSYRKEYYRIFPDAPCVITPTILLEDSLNFKVNID